ncbi:MAG: hemolysin family protein [Alphaproteobacteria bacterium]
MSGTSQGENGDSRRAAGEPQRRTSWRDLLRFGRRRNGEGSLRDTLEELIERHEEDEHPVDPAERVLLENTLRLRNVTAEDVSVPRADIVAIEIETPLDEVIAVMGTSLHSRLPVYRKDLDDVVGMVHVKDVLVQARQATPAPLSALIKQVLFVSPSMRVLDLLLQMRLSRIHMALVVDEYGGIDGLVTIENIVEEIVGEIRDEHEIAESPRIVPRPDGTLIADARVSLEDFEELVGAVLTDEEREDIDTLGGLVFTLIGRVPTRGELVTHASGIEFEVLEGDPRRLKKLRIRNVPPISAAAQ